MPSPFPGMDPYLEGSEWSSVHVALSAEMARQLAPKVRPKYIVRTANKRGEGYREYLDKRRRLLCSMAHLIEIDLLRRGRRVPMQQALSPLPYCIFLSRTERRPMMEVWPIQLHMRLPVIPVPLLAEDPDVTLDVQLALDTVYDAFNYDLSIDYTRPAEIPLIGEAARWADTHLRQAGIVTRNA